MEQKLRPKGLNYLLDSPNVLKKKKLKNGMLTVTFKDPDISVVPLRKIFSRNSRNFLLSVILSSNRGKILLLIKHQNYP